MHPHLKEVILFDNGQVMVFGDEGEQLRKYQGPFATSWPLINQDASGDTVFRIASFRGGWMTSDRHALNAFHDQFER